MPQEKKITFDTINSKFIIESNTDYSLIADIDYATDVVGGIKLEVDTGSGYATLYDNSSLTATNYTVDIDASNPNASTQVSQVAIPLSDSKVLTGLYKITTTELVTLTTGDTTISVVTSFDYEKQVDVNICLSHTLSCVAPLISFTDNGNYTFNGVEPTTSIGSLTLTYPTSSSQTPLVDETLPLSLSTNNVWTGSSSALATITHTYDFEFYSEIVKLTAEDSVDVVCDSLCSVYNCVKTTREAINKNKGVNTTKYNSLLASYNEAMSVAEQIDMAVSCSDLDSIEGLVSQIKSILNCDCSSTVNDCSSSTSSQKVLGIGNIVEGDLLTVTDGELDVEDVLSLNIGDGLTLTSTESGVANVEANITQESLDDLAISLAGDSYHRTYASSGNSNEEFANFDLLEWTQGSLDGYTHIGQSSCASYNKTNGVIMSVFRAGFGHVANGSKFYMTKSTNGGQTWSSPTPLAGFTFDASYDYRNQAGGYTSNGKYILIYDKYQDGGSGHSQIKSIYSDDDGVTWSAEADGVSDLTMDWSISGLSSDVLEFPNGDVGIPFYQSNSTTLKRFFAIAISSDGGSTFTSYKKGFEIDYTSSLNWGEPTMVMLDDKTILCVMDSVDDSGRMYQYVSKDSGDTWSFQGLLPFDSTTLFDSENQFRSRLHEVNIFGKRMIELIYVKRQTMEAKRILANPSDLSKDDGHDRWSTDTLVVFHTFTLGQGYDGNSSVIHPNGNFRGLYVAEDQTNSSLAQLDFIRTPNDIYDVATKLSISKSNVAMNGAVVPNFTPHWYGQSYVDYVLNKGYMATGLDSSSDWTVLN